ncbi:MAG: SRPBCC family protein [Planctomycetota bacterium]
MEESHQDRIVKVIDLRAPVDRVWAALTNHKEFGEWFRVQLDGPFEVGAITTGHITFPGHEHVRWESWTEELTPKSRFRFSWPPSAVDPETSYDDGAKVMVEFALQPTADGTCLTITESGFLIFPASKRAEILRSNEQGWEIQAGNIAEFLDCGSGARGEAVASGLARPSNDSA